MTTINDPSSPQTAVRSPRVKAYGNGTLLPTPFAAEITSNNYYHCDTFSLSFATSRGPIGWWDVQPPWLLDVEFSLDGGNSFFSMCMGEADRLDFDVQAGALHVTGRDLSARLIETKTTESFLNQTSSQIATTLAGRHGLKAQVTATTTIVGRYYEQDKSKVTLGQFSSVTTEWDLLVYLAQREQFDVFVRGTTLYFQPQTLPTAPPFAIQWTPAAPVPRLNAISIHCDRSLTIAKDIQVEIRSWNSKQAKGFTVTYKAPSAKGANATGATNQGKPNTTQRYTYVVPNLTQDQALKQAQYLATELTKHERIVDIEMPGELALTPRNLVQVSGTSTSFDQTYYIDSIHRSMSWDGGYKQLLRLKNSSPRSQAIVT